MKGRQFLSFKQFQLYQEKYLVTIYIHIYILSDRNALSLFSEEGDLKNLRVYFN